MIAPRLAFAAAATLAVGACQYMPWHTPEAPALSAPVAPDQPAGETAPVTARAACGVLASRGWEAWVNRMPGPGARPAVYVVGEVDMPTGGYTFEWQQGPLDRSATPALRLKLAPIAPEGMALQAITTEAVRFEAPALAAKYSRVIITCGDRVLAEIAPVSDVF